MDLLEIIKQFLDLGLVIGAPVLVAWVIIRGLRLAKVELSVLAQKYVVYALCVASSLLFSPIPLPDPSADPGLFLGALAALAGGVMKAAQAIYDKAWKALEAA